VLLFMVAVVLLLWMRPKFLVDSETNDWKPFGLGPGKSCFNITTLIVLLALTAYLLTACVGTSISKWKRRQSGGAPPAVVTPPPIPIPAVVTPPPIPIPAVVTPPPVVAPQVSGGGGGGSSGVDIGGVGEPFGFAFGLLQ